nr:hypothetical protein [Tanacetum cinerariifolium]
MGRASRLGFVGLSSVLVLIGLLSLIFGHVLITTALFDPSLGLRPEEAFVLLRIYLSSSNNNTSSTNGAVNTAQAVNTAHGVSTDSTQVNAAYSTNIDNLSDADIYVFFASQPNSPQLVHEDLQQIHQDDMKDMDLRWQMAMLTMRARRGDILLGSAKLQEIKTTRTRKAQEGGGGDVDGGVMWCCCRPWMRAKGVVAAAAVTAVVVVAASERE